MAIKIFRSSATLNMPSENSKNQAKNTVKKDSLRRRLSGIFLPNIDSRPSPVETTKLEKSSDNYAPAKVIPRPTRRFFSFPSYRKKATETVPITITTEKIPPKEPATTREVKIQEKLPVKRPVARIQHDTPGPQHAYKISLRKLQQSSRRPLIQILLIHQTITKATLKLRSEGMHSVKLMHEHPDARGSSRNITFVRRRSGPNIQRFSSPPPYSTVETRVNDRDDDVPLGLLQREFLGPTAASIFVA